ncbi:uroporphyrinogen decarboxylase [Fibrobacterota bacterium]
MNSSLFIDTLKGKKRERPPVWFMRQAGRCLPSYNKLRETYSFMELMEDPKLAAEVTLLPVHELGVDAAILFSDILVIPQALGMELAFTSDGPKFGTALKDLVRPEEALQPDPRRLSHVYAAIEEIKKTKPRDIPLIGFCGGPLTVFCYMVQGLGSNHQFPDALKMIHEEEQTAQSLLNTITDISIEYALHQVQHGIQAFQLFETWAGLLPSQLYFNLILPHAKKILDAVRGNGIPVIFFPRLMGDAITELTSAVTDCISLDQQMSLKTIRDSADPALVLQGNLDPELLLKEWNTIEPTLKSLGEFGRKNHNWIFNLGHGVMPATSSATLKRIVGWVKEYDWQR